MAYPVATVDAEGVLRNWLNSLTSSLVGNAQPFVGGFHLKQPSSPYRGAHAVLARLGGTDAWNEARADNARITCSIFAPTKQVAATAAIAYANILRTISTIQPTAAGVRLRAVDNITGPIYIPSAQTEGRAEQYLVDADVYFFSS
jgi:hypothetical protein